MRNLSYEQEMNKLIEEVGHVIVGRVIRGELINRLYMLFGISRTSHLAYLNNSDSVPDYIWNQLDTFNSLPPFQKVKLVFERCVDLTDLPADKALSQVIKGWEIMTGSPFDSADKVRYAGQFDVKKVNEKIQSVMANDPSCIGAGLLFSSYFETCKNLISFESVRNVLNQDSHQHRNLAGYTLGTLFLENSVLAHGINQFKEKCRNVIEFYKPGEQVKDELFDRAFHIYLRAKHDFTDFAKYCVSRSAKVASNEQLKIQEQIFVFNSVEHLIEQSSMIPNGFSLSMIRPERAFDSFFAMIVKSGEDIHLLTDKPKSTMFQRDAMSSRNQRYNLSRYENSYFPYEMMNLQVEDNGRVLVESESTEVAISDSGLRVLGTVRSMYSDSILWLTFLMEECRNQLISKKLALPNLSYVSQESVSHALLESKSGASNLPVNYQVNTSIKVKKSTELNRDNFLVSNPRAKRFMHKNHWMEDKFDKKIDQALLYIPAELSTASNLLIENKRGKVSLATTDGEGKSIEKMGLKALPSTSVGTAEEIQAEADLIARYNKSVMISKLMNEEFEANKVKMEKWIAEKISKNLPTLMDDIISLNHDRFAIGGAYLKMVEDGTAPEGRKRELVRQVHVKKHKGYYDSRSTPTELQKALEIRDKNNYAYCYITGDEPDLSFYLNVSTVYDLMLLTGLSIEELPVELRNWNSRSDQVADRMSDCYDPVEALANPWDNLKIFLSIPLSKSYVLKRRKELGVKGRFVKPLNYYDCNEDPKAEEWYRSLFNTQVARGENRVAARQSYSVRPEFHFYS